MTLHIPPEYENELRRAAAAAGYANVEKFVIEKLLGSAQEPAGGFRGGGQWKGQVTIADDFDELPDDLGSAFGMKDGDESTD